MSRIRRILGTALAGSAAAGLLVLAPGVASADQAPTTAQLLAQCSSKTKCQFHPQSYREFYGPAQQRGGLAVNCGKPGSTNPDHSISWSETTAETNSVGVAISAGAGFAKTFEVAVEASYGHSWEVSHTKSNTETVHPSAGHKQWINVSPAIQQATGWYELHFDKRFFGHYTWYVNGYTESGSNVDRADVVSFPAEVPLTAADRAQFCH